MKTIFKQAIIILCIGLVMYMIGFGHGQASAYKKKTDDTSLDSLYSNGNN